ncbi:4-hydroxy-tetrahydrodipicolinate synthase [Candidatus Endowatersipora endosymbiont of Watersipora subatra]|uniref:4-hydroxy-tetrahydrodipicolinate synthase n=1 Tax=Candidatus Endowatersipora endosymbiont of Watersipora subatra TaxID=3077946 RepID=UPI00312C87B9
MSYPEFKGSLVALVTPFTKDGLLDEDAFANLVNWQISQGTHGLVPVGTTGESPTLFNDEHKQVVEICVDVAARRVPVIAGAGSNNTAEAIDFVKFSEKVGADGVLVVTPYYNKPNQRGLKTHFESVARSTTLPIFIYNIPSRSVIDMTSETMGELVSAHDNIIGVKDATLRIDRVSEQRLHCGPNFIQLSGEDSTSIAFNANGGKGCISVTANVAPAMCADIQNLTARGDYKAALALQDRLFPLHKALFIEPNPGGVKYALSLLGRAENIQRAPLVPIEASTEEKIRLSMVHAGLIN